LRTLGAAYAVDKHLAALKQFSKYTSQGLAVVVEYYTAEKLPSTLFSWAFELTKLNMKALYERTWRWKDCDKRSEMKENGALYLVALQSVNRNPIAFAQFRFLFEEEKQAVVLYLYELQVSADYQGKGIGKLLMQILEQIGSTNSMKFIMLTVFTANDRARSFYTKCLNYSIDETSPNVEHESEKTYEILSKPLAPIPTTQ